LLGAAAEIQDQRLGTGVFTLSEAIC